jgi:hypothetical protein
VFDPGRWARVSSVEVSVPLVIVAVTLFGAGPAEAGPLPAEAPIVAAPRVASQLAAPRLVALPEATTRCGPGLTLCPAPSLGRVALTGSAATGLVLASAALGVAAGLLPPMLQFNAHGRPDPMMHALGFGVGLGVGVAASQLLAPLAAPLANEAGYRGRIAEARAEGWRRSRWALLGAGAGLATLTVGAGLERREFGAGQGALAVGAATVLLSGLVYTVLEVSGVLGGHHTSRQWESGGL